ncbi:MAG TPA: HlyD family efflux transporter periplasmic adaptor subunit [Burkholderiaceae bacterium]|nr:HlyD family efflux transporter periplasmic adaptor subunit [Burkholderiaceae bacterium]
MKITRGWLLTGLAVVAVAAVVAWAFAPKPIEVEVAHVTRGHFEAFVEEDGKSRLRDRYVVAAPLTGVLSRVTLREGDSVEAGAVVAALMPVLPPLHDQRTLLELRARVTTARALADRAGALLGASEIELARARNDLKRSEELARGGFISEYKLDTDMLVVRTAQKNVESAANAQRAAAFEVEQALAALAAVERGAPGAGFEVRSPVRGRVVRVAQTSETPLAAGTPLLEIGDTRQLEIVAELLTTEALQLRAGAPVVIDRWGGARPLAGHVRMVEPGAFTKISALGVEEQRVRVLIDIDSPPEQWQALGDAYRVTVRIITSSVENVTLVPASALFPLPGNGSGATAEAPGAMAVFAFERGRARLRTVQIEARNSQVAWVRSGAQAGDAVIVYPPANVHDGARVKARAD